ncbi:MAG TPA: membrane lipoprotein lipid attachment site-containing protein [Terricaulis sp.]|mgnify:CR=1 FL=1|nr:membrane lipoprotein lipid attachment site-containing protein [Terricaulis sp.]
MKRFILSLSALATLAGCGIPGGLERPDPMWGSEEAIAHECTRELRRGEVRDPRCAERQQAPQPQQ